MSEEDTPAPPRSAALDALPYALPLTAGFAWLVWGTVELADFVTKVTDDLPDLLLILTILFVAFLALTYGVAGLLSVAIRDSR